MVVVAWAAAVAAPGLRLRRVALLIRCLGFPAPSVSHRLRAPNSVSHYTMRIKGASLTAVFLPNLQMMAYSRCGVPRSVAAATVVLLMLSHLSALLPPERKSYVHKWAEKQGRPCSTKEAAVAGIGRDNVDASGTSLRC